MTRNLVSVFIWLFSIYVVVSLEKISTTTSGEDVTMHIDLNSDLLKNLPGKLYHHLLKHSTTVNVTLNVYKAWNSHWLYQSVKNYTTKYYNKASSTWLSYLSELKNFVNSTGVSRSTNNTKSRFQRLMEYLEFLPSVKASLPETTKFKLPVPEFTRGEPLGFTLDAPAGKNLDNIELFYRRNKPLDNMEEMDRVDHIAAGIYMGVFTKTGDRFVFRDNFTRFFDNDILYVFMTYYFGKYPDYDMLQQIHSVNISSYP